MSRLNSKGPENCKDILGRKLGTCAKNTNNSKLGIGMGLRRKSGGGKGLAKRIKSGENYARIYIHI